MKTQLLSDILSMEVQQAEGGSLRDIVREIKAEVLDQTKKSYDFLNFIRKEDPKLCKQILYNMEVIEHRVKNSPENVDFDALMKKFPEVIKAKIYSKGIDKLNQGRYEDAWVCFSFLLAFDSEKMLIWLMNGVAALKLESYFDAVRSFSFCIELDPSYCPSYLYLIESLFEAGKEKEARLIFQILLETIPLNLINNQEFTKRKFKELKEKINK